MIHNIAQMNFRTHAVHIAQNEDSGEYILFKYNDRCCDFTVVDDQLEASDWIVEPLPTSYYRVSFPGEE